MARTDYPWRLFREWTVGLALGGAALSVYIITLAPGLLMNDSGEFQTLVSTLGNTHPTGYPVYLLLAKPLTWLPWHDVAWRVNLASAMAAAMAVTGLYVLGRVLTGRRWLPLAAAVALAVSPTFWSQAIIAEVYTPAAAMMVTVLLSLAIWQRNRHLRWLFLAGFLGGLSIGVHLSVALMAPAALMFVMAHKDHRWRNTGVIAAGAMTGCITTLAAFAVVDGNRPPSDYFQAVIAPSRSTWGLTADDLDGLADRMKFSLAAVQYQDNLHQPTAADLRRQLGSYLQNLPRELPWLWLLAAAVGTVCLTRVNWRFALLLGMTLAAHLFYVMHHDMGDIHVGYIPTYVLVTIAGCAALGCIRGREPLPAEPARPAGLASGPSSVPEGQSSGWLVVEATTAVVLLAATLAPLAVDDHFMSTGRPRVWVPPGEPPFDVDYSSQFEQQLTACTNDLEDDAIIFTDWGRLYPFYYVAHVRQRRTGLVFVQTYPAIGQSALAESAVAMIHRQIETRPVYVSEPLPELARDFTFQPVHPGGMLLFRLQRRATALPQAIR